MAFYTPVSNIDQKQKPPGRVKIKLILSVLFKTLHLLPLFCGVILTRIVQIWLAPLLGWLDHRRCRFFVWEYKDKNKIKIKNIFSSFLQSVLKINQYKDFVLSYFKNLNRRDFTEKQSSTMFNIYQIFYINILAILD